MIPFPRLFCGILLLLALPATGHAQPHRVDFQVMPCFGLNTRIAVSASFRLPPQGVTFHLQRLDAGRHPPREVRVYTVLEAKQPSATRLRGTIPLDDLAASPFETWIETMEFLPLGLYRVEVRDQKGALASVVRDTRSFPVLVRRDEKHQESLSPLRVLNPLPFNWPGTPTDRLLRGRRLLPIKPSAPAGMTRVAGLRFVWSIPSVRTGSSELWLYVLDEERVVWHTRTNRHQASYKGPRLTPGKTYYWILGGRRGNDLLTFDRLQGFSVRSP